MHVASPWYALTVLAGGAVGPVPAEDFQWRGVIPAGKSIEVIGINGSIDASGTTGSEVQVSAMKTGRKSDPDEVKIQVVEHADGITICAVYPSGHRDRENECRPGGKGPSDIRNNDVKVTWTVRIPRGVGFLGRTVNGDVAATRLTAPVEVRTVNGEIDIETTSWASASTVNGSIDATMGSTGWDGDAEFDTVNGRISLDLPRAASLEVHASTVNGSMSTDFPLSVRGKWGPRRMSGTIGEGGRTLSMSTVNGDMELRRIP